MVNVSEIQMVESYLNEYMNRKTWTSSFKCGWPTLDEWAIFLLINKCFLLRKCLIIMKNAIFFFALKCTIRNSTKKKKKHHKNNLDSSYFKIWVFLILITTPIYCDLITKPFKSLLSYNHVFYEWTKLSCKLLWFFTPLSSSMHLFIIIIIFYEWKMGLVTSSCFL